MEPEARLFPTHEAPILCFISRSSDSNGGSAWHRLVDLWGTRTPIQIILHASRNFRVPSSSPGKAAIIYELEGLDASEERTRNIRFTFKILLKNKISAGMYRYHLIPQNNHQSSRFPRGDPIR